MFKVSELYIYPVKSLGGIKLDKAVITDRGFKYDRRWMLIDANNRFISQRECAKMALLKTHISAEYLMVTNTSDGSFINVPLHTEKEEVIQVSVWDDTCYGQLVDDSIDKWFTDTLGMEIRLVYMPESTRRFTDPAYAPAGSITSFSDAYPFLIIGQSSLDDLNDRLNNKISINRFRPNIVFTGGSPYQEDVINSFTINNIHFNGVKLCARCPIITIDQADASKGKEPTKTLATYRAKNNKIYFGQNLIHRGVGTITVGDELSVLSTHNNERFLIPAK
jgi:uncharacterized protein YcbX